LSAQLNAEIRDCVWPFSVMLFLVNNWQKPTIGGESVFEEGDTHPPIDDQNRPRFIRRTNRTIPEQRPIAVRPIAYVFLPSDFVPHTPDGSEPLLMRACQYYGIFTLDCQSISLRGVWSGHARTRPGESVSPLVGEPDALSGKVNIFGEL